MNFLTYDQARPIIEDGDIVLFHRPCTWKHPIDALISFATGSPFTHCNFAFWVEIGGVKRLMAVEAQGGTARRVINESFYKDYEMVVFKGIKSWDSISADALSLLAEKKYSYLTAVYSGLRDFAVQHFGLKLPKMQHPGEICSEFCARLSGFADADISPGDLYDQLLTLTTQKTA
jgi:hypothetical protein